MQSFPNFWLYLLWIVLLISFILFSFFSNMKIFIMFNNLKKILENFLMELKISVHFFHRLFSITLSNLFFVYFHLFATHFFYYLKFSLSFHFLHFEIQFNQAINSNLNHRLEHLFLHLFFFHLLTNIQFIFVLTLLRFQVYIKIILYL